MSVKSFIDSITPAVLKDYKKTGVLPSVTIAQAMLESSNGDSELANNYNNLFGVKAGGSWRGQSIGLMTKEEVNGQMQITPASFRVYNNIDQSITDHSKLFWNSTKYTQFLEASKKKDYVSASNALTGVYATDSQYGQKLIDIIQKYNLDKLDKGQAIPDSVWNQRIGQNSNDKQTTNGTEDVSLNPLNGLNQTFSDFFTKTLPKMGWVLIGIIFIVFGVIFLFNDEGGTASE